MRFRGAAFAAVIANDNTALRAERERNRSSGAAGGPSRTSTPTAAFCSTPSALYRS